jgi:hypothetical protein
VPLRAFPVIYARARDGVEPADMFCCERVAYVADPEGNLVALAAPPQT